jgi:flagellar basal body-associated protein FliL
VKGKLKFVIPLVVLIVIGGGYKFVLAKPAPKKMKVEGAVYVMPKEFLLNLSDSHFAKLSVALVLPESEVAAAAGGGEGATPPEGYGALPQEAAIRAVVTDTITDANASDLTNRKRRTKLRDQVLKAIKAHTDVKAHDVLFTDVAVQ